MGHMIEEVALSRGHEIVCRIDTAPSNSPIEGERKGGKKKQKEKEPKRIKKKNSPFLYTRCRG